MMNQIILQSVINSLNQIIINKLRVRIVGFACVIIFKF